MGVFEMVVFVALITTVGNVISGRRNKRSDDAAQVPQLPPGEIENIRETMSDLNDRVARLEEERDFYKQLLDTRDEKKGLGTGD